MTPVPDDAVPDITIGFSTAADIEDASPWVSDWVDAERARSIIAWATWTGDPGVNNLGVPRIEFSDDGVTVVASDVAYTAMSYAAPSGWFNDPDIAATTASYPFRWPFVCPYRYARLAGTSTGVMSLVSIRLHAAKLLEADATRIDKLTLLESAARDRGTSDSDLITGCDDVRALLLLYGFPTGEITQLTSLALLLSPDGTNIFNASASAFGSDMLPSGATISYDDLADRRVTTLGWTWRTQTIEDRPIEPRSPWSTPMDQLAARIGIGDTQTGTLDLVLFRRPSGAW